MNNVNILRKLNNSFNGQWSKLSATELQECTFFVLYRLLNVQSHQKYALVRRSVGWFMIELRRIALITPFPHQISKK